MYYIFHILTCLFPQFQCWRGARYSRFQQFCTFVTQEAMKLIQLQWNSSYNFFQSYLSSCWKKNQISQIDYTVVLKFLQPCTCDIIKYATFVWNIICPKIFFPHIINRVYACVISFIIDEYIITCDFTSLLLFTAEFVEILYFRIISCVWNFLILFFHRSRKYGTSDVWRFLHVSTH